MRFWGWLFKKRSAELPKEVQNACDGFEEVIRGYEAYLYGFILYHQTSPEYVQKLQQIAYRQSVDRLKDEISRAKRHLGDVRAGKANPNRLAQFAWLPWTPDMEERVLIMLAAYDKTFPSRPKKPLNKKQLAALKETVIDLI